MITGGRTDEIVELWLTSHGFDSCHIRPSSAQQSSSSCHRYPEILKVLYKLKLGLENFWLLLCLFMSWINGLADCTWDFTFHTQTSSPLVWFKLGKHKARVSLPFEKSNTSDFHWERYKSSKIPIYLDENQWQSVDTHFHYLETLGKLVCI